MKLGILILTAVICFIYSVPGYCGFDSFFDKSHNSSTIGCIDMMTKKLTLIHEFDSSQYMAYRNYFIDKYIVIPNPHVNKIFSLEKNRVINDFTDNELWSDGCNMDWLDDETMFVYNKDIKTISRHSIISGETRVINLPFINDDKEFMMMSISPDRRKIAILYGNTIEMESHPGDLYIISVDGVLLYKYTDIVNLRTIGSFEKVLDMAWLDDGHIVIEDRVNDEGSGFNIVKLNIKDGCKEGIIDNVIMPVTLPGSGMTAARKMYAEKSEYVILSDNSIVGIINEGTDEYNYYDNLFFIDSDHLVYNKNNEVFLFTISRNCEEYLCSGTIIGSSPDRKLIYYMTDCMPLNICY